MDFVLRSSIFIHSLLFFFKRGHGDCERQFLDLFPPFRVRYVAMSHNAKDDLCVFLLITRARRELAYRRPTHSRLILEQGKMDGMIWSMGSVIQKGMQLQRRKLWPSTTRLLLWLLYLLSACKFYRYRCSVLSKPRFAIIVTPTFLERWKCFRFRKLHFSPSPLSVAVLFPCAKWVQIYLLPLSNCHLANLGSRVGKKEKNSGFSFALQSLFFRTFYWRKNYSAISWIATKGVWNNVQGAPVARENTNVYRALYASIAQRQLGLWCELGNECSHVDSVKHRTSIP